jgi:predicted Zn-dependent protease
MRYIVVCLGILVAGCTVAPTGNIDGEQSAPVPKAPDTPKRSAKAAVQSFNKIAGRMKPVGRKTCKNSGRPIRCDFRIVLDAREDNVVNAYQTVNQQGRPQIVFTMGLLREARNDDELAFVLGHEMAHHIEGHLGETQMSAQLGAILLGTIASAATSGASGAVQSIAVDTAQQAGAFVGSRQFSKQNELEADALGTKITMRAGYDPLKGALFFSRVPDPGDRFLGSHPPNAQRFETVKRTAAGLR